MLSVLDLFSGIGGFSLGLERTGGFHTVAFCEIEDYPRRVLAKHWPTVPQYHDIRELTGERLLADGIVPDVLCGGFPCQDISTAGAGAGIAGARSGLWRDYARLIGELRPRYVIVENVAALLGRGLGRVLGDLASIRYDAEWRCVRASDVGAPHRRERVWIVAYPHESFDGTSGPRKTQSWAANGAVSSCGDVAYAIGTGLEGRSCVCGDDACQCATIERGGTLSNAASDRRTPERKRSSPRYLNGILQLQFGGSENWLTEPDLGRVADGVSSRVDRLRGLGNAVIPQIVTLIGQAILAADAG